MQMTILRTAVADMLENPSTHMGTLVDVIARSGAEAGEWDTDLLEDLILRVFAEAQGLENEDERKRLARDLYFALAEITKAELTPEAQPPSTSR
jgi:signal transduction histidine kinase